MDDVDGRVLPLDGVHNFRDFGGYKVAGGGRLRRGVLWRSGQHYRASDADLTRIAGLGLVSVFDLRTDGERERMPCRRPEGFTGHVFTIAKAIDIEADAQAVAASVEAREPASAEQPTVSVAPAIADAAQTVTGAVTGATSGHAVPQAERPRTRDPRSMRESLRGNYAGMPFRPPLAAMILRYAAELARRPGPSLVNCMAGKDRTGLTVALVQRALGVHQDDVMADYLLTNTAGDPSARIAAGALAIRDTVGEMTPEVLAVLMGVEAEYLATAFAAIRERHGSEEAYFEAVLGLDAAARDSLRGALVEG